LNGRGGQSAVIENALRHVIKRVTDEGLIIEIFDLEDAPLFDEGMDSPTPLLHELENMFVDVSRLVTNTVGVGGYVRADPVVLAQSPVWELSAMRAGQMRKLMESAGMPTSRIQHVTGHASREPAASDPMAVRNNRIEVILLRTKME
jgi:chemotaxis protein MotB